jgi:hypothetical protein
VFNYPRRVDWPKDPAMVETSMFFADECTGVYLHTFSMKHTMTLEEFYKCINLQNVMVFPIVSISQVRQLDLAVQKKPVFDVYKEWFVPKFLTTI